MPDRAGRARRLAALLIPAALLALGLFARAAAARAFTAFTAYRTPYTFEPSGQQPGEALSPRVAVVLVDGLGLSASRGLPYLDELRARGASFDCRVGLPSLSLPARAVMMSGAWQDVSGQATNYHPHALGVEHVFTLARRAGLATGLAAGRNMHTMFAPEVTEKAVYAKEKESDRYEVYAQAMQATVQSAEDLLRRTPGGFVLLDLYIVDDAGHTWGTAAPEYARAAAEADAAVRRLAGQLDLQRDTLVVTADHGHVSKGGHGGPEPEVMEVPLVLAGKGVRKGATGRARQVDLAPTLSVLLGLPLPAASQGRPLLDALDAPDAVRLQALRNAVLQRRAFVRSFDGLMAEVAKGGPGLLAVGAPATPAPAADEAGLRAELDGLDAAEAAARERALAREQPVRLRRALLLAALPLVLLGAVLALRIAPPAEAGRAVLFGLAAAAAYHLLLAPLGLGYSLTAVNKDEWLQPFFMKDMALAVACVAAAVTVLAVLARRRGTGLFDACREAWLAAAAFCTVLLMEVAWSYARQDVFSAWRLPDQAWGMSFYLHTLAVMAVGLGAPALALPALLARALPLRARA
jgi:arylsulfatase A-like enzyme